MKTATLIATAVLASAALATPTLAQTIVQQTFVTETPVNLNQFVGQNLFGSAHANLGTVSRIVPNAGVIGLSGRYGEYAWISMSFLVPDGATLHAPTLTQGDVKHASDVNLSRPGTVLVGPNVFVIEPQLG